MAQQPPPITLRGDEAQLFATHHDRLLRAVRRRVIAPDAVIEDAVSITWLTLMRRQPDRGPTLFSWLVTVAEREAWRLAARGTAVVEFDDLTCTDTPTDDGVESMVEARHVVRSAAQAMNNRQRRIVGLRVAGYRYDEIAALTGDTVRTVERQLYRGRQRARKAA